MKFYTLNLYFSAVVDEKKKKSRDENEIKRVLRNVDKELLNTNFMQTALILYTE